MTRSVVQLGGQALKLDADGDTTIEVSSDDVLVVDTAGNEALKIDANGQVTKSLQCMFFVNKSSSQNNVSNDGSGHLVTFDTERFDIGSNFASSTFTAPVTGKYLLYTSLRLDNVDTGASYYNVAIATSNHTHEWIEHFNTSGGDYNYFTAQVTAIADMDASDTATVQITQNGGTSQTDIINSSGRTLFSGYLLG